jgi:hypothetical protein
LDKRKPPEHGNAPLHHGVARALRIDKGTRVNTRTLVLIKEHCGLV